MFDLCFFVEQFIAPLPDSYIEFAHLWKSHFTLTYDTKTLAGSAGEFNRTALSHLYYRCQKDKRISNNLMFAYDKPASIKFCSYDQTGGQEHDAGFDAYMTGHVFAAFCKRIEICQLLEQVSEKKKESQVKQETKETSNKK